MEAEIPGADDETQTLSDMIPAEDTDVEEALTKRDSQSFLYLAINNELKPKEREILQKRYGMGPDCEAGRKWTLEQLGEQYGVTRECIRQTEKRALSKLKTAFLHQQMVD